jgi:hypothetical protein
MTDDAPNEAAAELAERLIDEVGMFLEERGGAMTAVEIGTALGYLISVGAEMMECPGCRKKYIAALVQHIADLEAASAQMSSEHVH